ncbi:MAG: TIGR04086 family membrane protein [Clostridia bacterium]|nr:TIGR04086 family membrane protein [Clostridia bacterium]
MPRTRKSTLKSLVFGLIIAILFTVGAMLILAAALVYLQIGDGALRLLNQLIKYLAIFLGVRAAVPRGGEKGLVTGVVLALIYIILGYALYLLLGGGSFSIVNMLGEILLGSAVGAVTGAVRANMSPRRAKAA